MTKLFALQEVKLNSSVKLDNRWRFFLNIRVLHVHWKPTWAHTTEEGHNATKGERAVNYAKTHMAIKG